MKRYDIEMGNVTVYRRMNGEIIGKNRKVIKVIRLSKTDMLVICVKGLGYNHETVSAWNSKSAMFSWKLT